MGGGRNLSRLVTIVVSDLKIGLVSPWLKDYCSTRQIEHPPIPPRRASVVMNVGQILKRHHQTVATTGFGNNFVRYSVKRLFEPSFHFAFATDSLHVLVCPPHATGLEVATAILVFAPPVVTLVTSPERVRRSNSQIVYAEVNPETKNRFSSVFGWCCFDVSDSSSFLQWT